MKLTEKNKAYIDALNYGSLLYRWRSAPLGDRWMAGETGKYWKQRMKELKDTVDHVNASKQIGWEG